MRKEEECDPVAIKIRKARLGDTEALWGALMDGGHYDFITRKAGRSQPDLAQTVVVELLAGIHRFQGTTNRELRAYVHTTLKNQRAKLNRYPGEKTLELPNGKVDKTKPRPSKDFSDDAPAGAPHQSYDEMYGPHDLRHADKRAPREAWFSYPGKGISSFSRRVSSRGFTERYLEARERLIGPARRSLLGAAVDKAGRAAFILAAGLMKRGQRG